MARYVVVANVEEMTRVFGTFSDYAKAQKLADRVNVLIEREEDEEFKDWSARNESEEMMPTGYGRAQVRLIHKPTVEGIKRFALGWLEAAAMQEP